MTATHTTTEWSIQPNEAFDMVLFLNAISNNDFYSRHYQGVREHYSPRLGDVGLKLIDQVVTFFSISGLCKLLSYFSVESLDDVIKSLQDFNQLINNIDIKEEYIKQLAANVSEKRELLLDCFGHIKESDIDENWRRNIKPSIQNVADQLNGAMSSLIPYHNLRTTLSTFLGTDLPSKSYQVYLATYIKPIAFQLSKQGMVTHQGPPGYMPLPKQIACICIHETIHGFPGSEIAQIEQEKLRLKSNTFNQSYLDIINNWHSGPEEFFVVGAEAYLTQALNLRTNDECIEYLNTQNNGMRFSMEIYKKLRKEKPEQNSNWMGFGEWVSKALKNNEIYI